MSLHSRATKYLLTFFTLLFLSVVTLADEAMAVPFKETDNPLLTKYQTPHQTPPFTKIKTEHFIPAIQQAIAEGNLEIKSIVSNPAPATFANTIEELERSGRFLSRITGILFWLNNTESTPALQAVIKEATPLLTKYANDIALNEPLFARVKDVYQKCNRSKLTIEQRTLLDHTYQQFARSGVNLQPQQKKRYREITNRLSELSLSFEQNVLAETNAYQLHITDRKELQGLPDTAIAAAAEAAKAKKLTGWVFTLQEPSFIAFIKYADNRELRAQLYKAYNSKGFRGNQRDNGKIIKEIANLRLELAKLLGYPTFAQYVLEERMAEKPTVVNDFQEKLYTALLPAAQEDVVELQRFAKQAGLKDELQPYDWAYYAEKLKKEKYAVSEETLRPYFKLEHVQQGIFKLAGKLYGLTFVKNTQIPVYQTDVTAYEVFDANQRFLGILYLDLFPRVGKAGGAWSGALVTQEKMKGLDVQPQVGVACNFSRPTAASPALLTLTEVTTFLHEFGHALHNLLSDVTYAQLAGTNVEWDFVELPSQFMENYAYEREFLDLFAVHYQSGKKIPQELLVKIKEMRSFHSAFGKLSQLRSGMVDMAWHNITSPVSEPVDVFENKANRHPPLLKPVEGTLLSTRFTHIFSGGYAAGYYSYLWAEVLEADAFKAFQEKGVCNKETAQAFRECILSKGGTERPTVLYKKFRGKEATLDALLEKYHRKS